MNKKIDKSFLPKFGANFIGGDSTSAATRQTKTEGRRTIAGHKGAWIQDITRQSRITAKGVNYQIRRTICQHSDGRGVSVYTITHMHFGRRTIVKETLKFQGVTETTRTVIKSGQTPGGRSYLTSRMTGNNPRKPNHTHTLLQDYGASTTAWVKDYNGKSKARDVYGPFKPAPGPTFPVGCCA